MFIVFFHSSYDFPINSSISFSQIWCVWWDELQEKSHQVLVGWKCWRPNRAGLAHVIIEIVYVLAVSCCLGYPVFHSVVTFRGYIYYVCILYSCIYRQYAYIYICSIYLHENHNIVEELSIVRIYYVLSMYPCWQHMSHTVISWGWSKHSEAEAWCIHSHQRVCWDLKWWSCSRWLAHRAVRLCATRSSHSSFQTQWSWYFSLWRLSSPAAVT